MTNEIWRDVVGYEGIYEVSNIGRVRSLDRFVRGKNGSRKPVKGRMLKLHLNKDGYPRVELNDASTGRCQSKMVHILIGEAFIDNPEDKPQINHINGVKDDNRVENLEWVTLSENRQHALYDLNKGQVKLTPDDVREIRKYVAEGFSNVDIGRMFGVHDTTICCIKNGHRWQNVK